MALIIGMTGLVMVSDCVERSLFAWFRRGRRLGTRNTGLTTQQIPR
jgi:hypothetical protein